MSGRTEHREPYKLHRVSKADKITIDTNGRVDGGSWTYRADPSKSPATLDLTPVRAPEVTYVCVYKAEGDRLTVLLQTFPELGRPRDFQDRSGTGVGKHVFERVKSGEVE